MVKVPWSVCIGSVVGLFGDTLVRIICPPLWKLPMAAQANIEELRCLLVVSAPLHGREAFTDIKVVWPQPKLSRLVPTRLIRVSWVRSHLRSPPWAPPRHPRPVLALLWRRFGRSQHNA